MDAEKLALMEATRKRTLEKLKTLRAEQRRLKWIALATIVAAGVARFHSLTATIVVTIFGASLFFVGHYVVFMHINDCNLTLKGVRKALEAPSRQP